LLKLVILREFSGRLVDGFLTELSSLLVQGGGAVEELAEFRPKAVNDGEKNKVRGPGQYQDNHPSSQSPSQKRPEPGDFSNNSSERILHDLYLYVQS
jgi:hypothetical protein